MDSDLESVFMYLISSLQCYMSSTSSEFLELTLQTISLVNTTDFDSQPKPESELMSLITRLVSHFNSIDLDFQPEPLSKLISLVSRILPNSPHPELQSFCISLSDPTHIFDHEQLFKLTSITSGTLPKTQDTEMLSCFKSLIDQTKRLNPEPELVSLIYQIFNIVKWGKRISLCIQALVRFNKGKFHVVREITEERNNKWDCFSKSCEEIGDTHFFCEGCNGYGHEEYEKAPTKIKHPIHPKHYLHLVWMINRLLIMDTRTRECYCCEQNLKPIFYYCSTCDFAINVACADKKPLLAIDHPKWHEHTLHWFPRMSSPTCNMCALAYSTSSVFMCPPCDLVVHRRCTSLPRVIKITRHLHRISFTFSFGQGDWSCAVCRKKIDIDYGGYSCINDNCSYAAHSRCATQSNVWDGIDLYGVPEEIEEEVLEPFVRISNGVIQHFTHQHHHLSLDENTERDYDDKKLCQICMEPIYFGNLYSCIECEFILHEKCANLSRGIHHPIHPHKLTLALADGIRDLPKYQKECSACKSSATIGFLYKCNAEGCSFNLHVPCATINEPLVHGSHMDPLFLTSKPGEERKCSVCEGTRTETFNCIECDFSLCFACASIPEKVRYKHDKDMLTLCYGKETSSMAYWCEICEGEIKENERFYKCGEYCCITLHMTCMLGPVFQSKPGSFWFAFGQMIDSLANNHHMTRPFCCFCGNRCSQNIIFRSSGNLFCSFNCVLSFPVTICIP